MRKPLNYWARALAGGALTTLVVGLTQNFAVAPFFGFLSFVLLFYTLRREARRLEKGSA